MGPSRCPHCQTLVLPEEAASGVCPACGGSLDGKSPPRRSDPGPARGLSSTPSPRALPPSNRETGVVAPLLLTAVLLAVGFAAFTAHVAYSGMHPLQSFPGVFTRPPRDDAARLGAVLDAGLTWALRICGAVVTLLGVGLALRRAPAGTSPGGVVVVLTGAILLTQHWAAGLALAVFGAGSVLASAWRDTGSAR